MTPSAALHHIHSLARFGIRPGLERMFCACSALGNPQQRLRFVHVAGTNGKGSTSTMVANMAQAAGLKTGLYTSPYVYAFGERMRVNGTMIPPDDLARLTQMLRDLTADWAEPLTEFEFVTALAFAWFAEQGCDLVVLEVGLGGRWDATNCIADPLCCVITKIALDHTHILGETLTEIAQEKAGILKPGCPVVSCCEQSPEVLAVLHAVAHARGCALHVAMPRDCEICHSDAFGTDAILAGLHVRVPLLGAHMVKNALTAVTVARQLGFSDAAICQGLAATRMQARLEVRRHDPLLLLDGSHNPDGAMALAAVLQTHFAGGVTLVCGMMRDKHVAAYLRLLQPHARALVAVAPPNPRALPAAALAALARDQGFAQVRVADSPQTALQMATGPVVVCGSFYLCGCFADA